MCSVAGFLGGRFHANPHETENLKLANNTCEIKLSAATKQNEQITILEDNIKTLQGELKNKENALHECEKRETQLTTEAKFKIVPLQITGEDCCGKLMCSKTVITKLKASKYITRITVRQ